MNTDVNNTL